MEPISFSFCNKLTEAGIYLHSCGLTIENKPVFKHFFAPIKENDLQRVFSICKSFTGLAVGLLADEGKINLDDRICDYFREYLPENPHEWLLSMTIRDMLSMKTCHVKSTYDKFDLSSDWVGSFFKTLPTKVPGTSFSYDTSGAHVLCALVERLSGMKLLDYIRMRLPELGLSKESYTLADGQGYSQGGTGLMCTLSDLLALGNLLLYANMDGHEPAYLSDFMVRYIREATSFKSDTMDFAKNPFEGFGYGYQLWMADHEGFVCYGLGGQFIMVHPNRKLVFACTADNIGKSSKNQAIFDCFYSEILDKISETVSLDELIDAEEKAKKEYHLLAIDGNYAPIFSKKWLFSDHVSSFISATLEVNEEEGHFTLQAKDTSYEIPFGLGYNIEFTLAKYEMRCAASGAYTEPDLFSIHLSILDTSIGSIDLSIRILDDSVEIESIKYEETLFDEFRFHLSGHGI